jgi:hypothetical protein
MTQGRHPLMPADTPDYMTDAWASCMSWAIGEPEIVGAFRADTGNKWRPAQSGLDAMIDKATGADKAFVEAFIRWANDNVWGPIDG